MQALLALALLAGCGGSRPAPSAGSNCPDPQPDPRYVCAQGCGPRLARPGDPPPPYVWAPPERVRGGKVYPCPICLPAGARIATPGGPVAVEDVRAGTIVWSLDAAGRRAAVPVVAVGSTPVVGHELVRIVLGDGRIVAASPGHRTPAGRALGSLGVGDTLDGAQVVGVARVAYGGERTYDLLPGSATGLYWADGVPLGSTLGP